MREQCGECGDVRWRSIRLKDPLRERINCLAYIYPFHVVLIWYTLTFYSYITLFHLCLFPVSLILTLVLILGAPKCKLIPSLKMSSYFAFVLMIANQMNSLGDLARGMNRKKYLYWGYEKKKIWTTDSKLGTLHTLPGAWEALFLFKLAISLFVKVYCSIYFLFTLFFVTVS